MLACNAIQEFEKQNKHRLFLIDSGQHVEIVDYILKNLSNSIEKINVFKNKKNITTINQTFFGLEHLYGII